MHRYTTEGVILKNSNYKDSHKIYSIFTKDYGKISAVALGVRKITSRRAGNLDTLNQVLVSINEDKNSFKTIQEVRTIRTYIEIKQDLKKMYDGFYIADLINTYFNYEHQDLKTYVLLCKTLSFLANKNSFTKEITNYFEYHLTDNLGFKIETERCVKCGRNYSDNWNKIQYNPNDGGIFCENCITYGLNIPKPALLEFNAFTKKVRIDEPHVFGDYIDRILKLHLKSLPEGSNHIAKIRAFIN